METQAQGQATAKLSAFESLLEKLADGKQTVARVGKAEKYAVAKDKTDETQFVVKAIGGQVSSVVFESDAVKAIQRFAINNGLEMFGHLFVKAVCDADNLTQLKESYDLTAEQTTKLLKTSEKYLDNFDEIVFDALTDNEKFSVIKAVCLQYQNVNVERATSADFDKANKKAIAKTSALLELAEKLKGETEQAQSGQNS